MTSSLVIMTNWILNQDNTFTFYDYKKIPGLTSGQTKEFKYDTSDKTYKMFEHRIPLSGKLVKSVGFDGYQYRYSLGRINFTVVVAFGRRMKESRKFVQELDSVLVMLGLKDPDPVPVPVPDVL